MGMGGRGGEGAGEWRRRGGGRWIVAGQRLCDPRAVVLIMNSV